MQRLSAQAAWKLPSSALRFVRPAASRRCSSAVPKAAEPSHAQKQVTGRGGIAALLLSAPMFAYAGYLWSLEQPSHIKGIIAGTWYSADGEAMIKFNSKGMCKHEGLLQSGDGQCPAVWTESGGTASTAAAAAHATQPAGGGDSGDSIAPSPTGGPAALGDMQLGFPLLGEVYTLQVQQWPHQALADLPLGDGVVVPAGSWVMQVGGRVWMRGA